MATLILIGIALVACVGTNAQYTHPATAPPPSDCPVNFVKLGSICYHFSTEQATWFSAWLKCAQMQANLASIETIEEANQIASYAVNRRWYTTWWVSGSDFAEENKWYWMATGHEIVNAFWCPGEPNDVGYAENCFEFSTKTPYCSNDANCFVNKRYVCEIRRKTCNSSTIGNEAP